MSGITPRSYLQKAAARRAAELDEIASLELLADMEDDADHGAAAKRLRAKAKKMLANLRDHAVPETVARVRADGGAR